MPLCRRDSSWFDAVIRGDTTYINNHKEQYQRLYDSRQSGPGVHCGWAGIHYAAALNNKEIFVTLFESEYDLLTDRPAEVHSPWLGRPAYVESGSSVIHILIAVNGIDLLQYILQRFQTNPEFVDLAGVKNDAGQTGLLVAPVVRTAAGMLWATNERVLRTELREITNQEQNVIQVVAMLGRLDYADLFLDLVGKQQKVQTVGYNNYQSPQTKGSPRDVEGGTVKIERIRPVIRALMAARDAAGRGWKQLSELQIEYPYYRTSVEERRQTVDILEAIQSILDDELALTVSQTNAKSMQK